MPNTLRLIAIGIFGLVNETGTTREGARTLAEELDALEERGVRLSGVEPLRLFDNGWRSVETARPSDGAGVRRVAAVFWS